MSNKLYMVEMIVPENPDDEFFETIPQHREKVHDLMYKDVIISYSVANDRSKVWAIFKTSHESDLIRQIDLLPLSKYMDYTYHELMFMELVPFKMNFSLN